MSKFPWRKYSNEELIDEFEKLKEYPSFLRLTHKTKFLPNSNMGKICSNYFFQKERMNTARYGHVNTVLFWKEKKEKIIEYNKNNPHKGDLFATCQFLNKTPCQFPPTIASCIYKMFDASSIFDPFAGWGDRCISAIACDIKYLGCDTNKRLKPCFDKMTDFFDINKNIRMIYDDCINILDRINFVDIIFSSPPFFDIQNKSIEIYKNDRYEDKFEQFMEECLLPLLKFKRCKWICFHLPKNMYDYVKKKFRKSDKIINFGTKRNYGYSPKDSCCELHSKIYCWKIK
jgi:hypothetical protein